MSVAAGWACWRRTTCVAGSLCCFGNTVTPCIATITYQQQVLLLCRRLGVLSAIDMRSGQPVDVQLLRRGASLPADAALWALHEQRLGTGHPHVQQLQVGSVRSAPNMCPLALNQSCREAWGATFVACGPDVGLHSLYLSPRPHHRAGRRSAKAINHAVVHTCDCWGTAWPLMPEAGRHCLPWIGSSHRHSANALQLSFASLRHAGGSIDC